MAKKDFKFDPLLSKEQILDNLLTALAFHTGIPKENYREFIKGHLYLGDLIEAQKSFKAAIQTMQARMGKLTDLKYVIWDMNKTHCPECGSPKIGVVYDSDFDKESLVCQSCKHEFSQNQSSATHPEGNCDDPTCPCSLMQPNQE